MNLVRPIRNFIGAMQKSAAENSIAQIIHSMWSSHPLALKVTAAAVPLLLLVGTTAIYKKWIILPIEPFLLGVTNHVKTIRAEELLENFKKEKWFSETNPLVDEKHALPKSSEAGKIYKFLRKTEHPKLINVGLWTDPANVEQAHRCISMLYVCASEALNEIEGTSDYKIVYLNSRSHYTGIFLFDFFDFYRRARMGYKTVTNAEGQEALAKVKGFEPSNFSRPGTREYQWYTWRSEILKRLNDLFSESQLRTSFLKKLID